MSTLSGKRIALVGGAGFIGHHLALRLKQLNADVAIIDNFQINNFLAFTDRGTSVNQSDLYLHFTNERLRLLRKAGIKVYPQDARNYHALSIILRDTFKPDVIIHLAAVSHAAKANKDPYSTFDHSSRTLENALDCARNNAKHFIYFSSSLVYGEFKNEYVTEEDICEPLGIYGALKYGGEKLVIAYNQVFGFDYTIIRPSALYGERCVSRRVGQIFIENALQNKKICIKGDGSDRLDFTYIDDLVDGITKVIQNENSHNQILNMTYGSSRSLADMANIIQTHFPNMGIQYLPKDELMPNRGTLSIEKAKTLIDYEPVWPLEKGFEKYIQWYKELPAEFMKECIVPMTDG